MRVVIRPIPATLSNEIFIFIEPGIRFIPGDVIQFMNIKEDGSVIGTQKNYQPGMTFGDIKPTMILSEDDTRALIEAFGQLALERGIEPNTESRAKGKLEATEKHLSDLRQLLKLK